MERETSSIRVGKPEEETKLTEIDQQGFKFINMTYSSEFTDFIKWMGMIRERMNRVDAVLPSIILDPMKNDIENFGLKTLTMRTKISMLDDIMVLIKTLQTKFEKKNLNTKENKDGKE